MAGKVQITGGDRLMRFLKALPKEAQAEVRATIKREAAALADAARAAAPPLNVPCL